MLRHDRPRIARFRAALDDLGYDALQRSLRGGFPRTPFPPYDEFSTTLRRVNPLLRTWFALLLLGRRLPVVEVERALGRRLIDDLLELGVLHLHGLRVDTGGLGLVSYRDRYLLATLDGMYPTNRDPDLTLYVGPSSYLLADALPLGGTRFDAVLDMCAGPGLLGILLAPVAVRVVMAELLEDALTAARFNAALNGVDGKVEGVRSDAWSGVGRRAFDLVVMNVPFVSSPEDEPRPAYADGGSTGMRVLGPVLAGLPGHLKKGGRALAYLEGPGDPERPFFAQLLAAVSGRELAIELVLLERIPTGRLVAQIRARDRTRRDSPARAPGMRRLLADQGATHTYRMLARIRRGAGGVSVVNAIPRLT